MCGISGFILNNYEPEYATSMARRFAKSLHHRGPNDEAIFSTKNCTLVSNRLSIIDIKNGGQPFHSEDGLISIIQNGEIYNYKELRVELELRGAIFKTQSDTEVILHGYLLYGISYLEKLNGMFAIAILDQNLQSLFLIRDRLGVKPLFYYSCNRGFFFASELKAFLEIPEFTKEIDSTSLYLFLMYNFVPLNRTIYKGVSHVAPGTFMKVALSNLKQVIYPYWKIENEREDLCDESIALDCIREIFDDAVKIRLRSDVPIALYLSSGLDSSLIASAAHQYSLGSLESYSIKFNDPHFDESTEAEIFSNELGIKNHKVLVDTKNLSKWGESLWFADQPHGDISFLAISELSSECHKSYKVVLTGDGGDELFGGYEKYLRIMKGQAISDYINDEYVLNSNTLDNLICTTNFYHALIKKKSRTYSMRRSST